MCLLLNTIEYCVDICPGLVQSAKSIIDHKYHQFITLDDIIELYYELRNKIFQLIISSIVNHISKNSFHKNV